MRAAEEVEDEAIVVAGAGGEEGEGPFPTVGPAVVVAWPGRADKS